MGSGLFRELTEDEEIKFRKWARDNYKPYNDISGIWHPVVQHECAKINKEKGGSLDTDNIPI